MWSLDPQYYAKGLSLDYLTDFPRVSSYFAKDYRKIEKIEKNQKISNDVLGKIESYNKKIKASSLVFENIENLKEAPAILTGQQPCLLTGPLFTVYKALTAIILAEKLKAVPVFWNASEDDDISEVNHFWVMNASLEKIFLPLEEKPFSRILLKREDINFIIRRLEELTPPTEFREKVTDIVKTSPENFSEMFSHILSALFRDYGLIVVEPHIFQDSVIPLYENLIEHPVEASILVDRAGSALEKGGYKKQLYKAENSCSFYLVLDGKRHTVTYDRNFYVDSREYTQEELLHLLHEHPDCFSSNVVSRPLFQDFLFSTLAYCAGPGEISYFAQMKEVYTFFGIEEPYIYPRFGATLVEKKVKKILDKYNFTLPDLYDPEKVLKTVAERDVREFFTTNKEEIMKRVCEIQDYAASIDSNLEKTGGAARTAILKEIEALEEKTAVSLKRYNKIMGDQVKKASLNVFPNQSLQERVLNIFQYAIRYNSILTALHSHFENARPGEHLIIEVGG